MQRERQQTFLQRRDDLLAGDGAGKSAAFGQNARIARLGRDGIALADNVTDRLDPGGELAHMLNSFLAIGVEERGAGLPVQNPVELPDKISDVANALAHALADKRRLLMRGVAGEEYATSSPFPGDERMKPVARGTPQHSVIRCDPSGEKPPDLSWLLHLPGILARQQHDLEAAMIAGADDERRRPGRIAELRRRLRQLSERCTVDPEVDDKPGLVEHEIFEGDAKRLPCSARGAVARDHVVGRDGTRRALVVAQMQRHMIRRLIETNEFGSQFDFDAVIGRRVRAQGRLDRRLREDHARRVTKRIGLANHVDPTDQLAPRAKMLRGRKRRDIGLYALRGADVVQQAKDLMVDRDRARLVVDIALTVDRKGTDIPVAEQAGRDDACRAVADHDHPKVAAMSLRHRRRAPLSGPP